MSYSLLCGIPRPPAGASLKLAETKDDHRALKVHSPASSRGLIEAYLSERIESRPTEAFPGLQPGPH